MNNDELRKLQLMELDMLKEFISICNKLNLRYFLLGGSILGTIRHKGFIPWDDDIDIGMPRKDYDKFIVEGQKYLDNSYFIQTNETDCEYINNFAKIRNSKTTFIESSAKHLNINHGIYMDIFPLDGFPKNKISRCIFNIKNKLYTKRISQVYLTDKDIEKTFKRKIINTIIKIILPNVNSTIQKKEKLLRKYDFEKCDIVANYCGAWGNKEIMPKVFFGDGYETEFENIKVIIPKQYDNYLKKVYGNYMELPKLEDRKPHHFTEVVDLNNTYLEYMKF